VVGTGRSLPMRRAHARTSTLLAQVAGHALNSIFLDSLMVDIERLERINRTLSAMPQELIVQRKIDLRPIKVLFISPSHPIERIAARFVHDCHRWCASCCGRRAQ
jgi:NTE family protein